MVVVEVSCGPLATLVAVAVVAAVAVAVVDIVVVREGAIGVEGAAAAIVLSIRDIHMATVTSTINTLLKPLLKI